MIHKFENIYIFFILGVGGGVSYIIQNLFLVRRFNEILTKNFLFFFFFLERK